MRAVEQARAQLLLQAADLPAQRRLRDAQLGRGAAEVLVVGHRIEVSDQPQVEVYLLRCRSHAVNLGPGPCSPLCSRDASPASRPMEQALDTRRNAALTRLHEQEACMRTAGLACQYLPACASHGATTPISPIHNCSNALEKKEDTVWTAARWMTRYSPSSATANRSG